MPPKLFSKHRDYCTSVAEANCESPKQLQTGDDYFVQKVTWCYTAGTPNLAFRLVQPGVSFSDFRPVSFDDVITAVRRLLNVSSEVDPLPDNMLKRVIPEFTTYEQDLFNCSLIFGQFQDAFKSVYIMSLPKKPGLNTIDMRTYLPSSSLSMVSKLPLARTACRTAAD